MSGPPRANGTSQAPTRVAIPRPDDPESWTSQNITAAIEERDTKVVAALTAYATKHKGEDNSAQEVVAWLQLLNQPAVSVTAPPAAPRGPGGPGAYGPGYGAPGGSYGAPIPDPAAAESEGGHGDETSGTPTGPPVGYGPPPGAEGGHGGPGGEAGVLIDPAEYESGMYGPGMTPGTGPQRGQKSSEAAAEQIASALIDALMAIHSLTSYQAARELLDGTLELPFSPEKTTGWTMTSLIKHVDGIHDPAGKILKQTIQQPDLVRSGSGDFDASRLEDLSLQEHWTSALSVMDGLMGLQSSTLSQPKRRNNNPYGGPEMMYEGGEAYPGAEGGNYPGAPPNYPGAPGANPGAPNNQQNAGNSNEVNPVPDDLTLIDFTQQQAVAARNYLWSPELVQTLAQRLNESETLMKDPQLLLLAGQLPTTSTRYAFQQFLEKNWLMNEDWTRNPSSFVRYDIFSKYLRDPGLVITLKELPREQQQSQGGNTPGGEYGYEGGAPGGAPPSNNRQQTQDPEKQREQRVKQLWFETSEKFTLALMDRMLSAAEAGSLPQSNLDELDIKLHRNAAVTLESRLELALGERTSDSEMDTRDKTTVNYVRIESSELGTKEVTHYKTALRKETEFLILNKNGMWLSSPVEKDRKTGELVSIDVLLSKNNARPTATRNNNRQQQPGFNDIAAPPPGYPGGGGNQMFVIEILVVRVPNPEIFLQNSGGAVSAR